MSPQIVINATPQESRVATLENGRLLQIEVERDRERSVVGSIYRGRVNRVLPGIQAAFVDIGLARSAFLPAADYAAPATERSGVAPWRPGEESGADGLASVSSRLAQVPIQDRLRDGQEVVVQIAKEPIGTKGARVTTNISLPGRLLVYLPHGVGVGVSRRIDDEGERVRLQSAVEAVLDGVGGVIVRTACEGGATTEIEADLRTLRDSWRAIDRDRAAPALLHRDLDVVLRTVRDLSAVDGATIVVDDAETRRRVVEFAGQVMQGWLPRVDLYDGPEPIFERFGVERQVEKALQPRVWLPSGGYIVVDPTEALTTIDVNSGRFVGVKDQRDTALRTNTEAARAVGEQLRLRNIGGVVVVDFIDMALADDRAAVRRELADALRSQAALAEVSPFSDLGLVEITRRRNRKSLSQQLCAPCPTCRGTGSVPSTASTAYAVLRKIRRVAATRPVARCLTVSLHPAIAGFFAEFEPSAVADLESEFGVEIVLHTSSDGGPVDFVVEPAPARPDDARGRVDAG